MNMTTSTNKPTLFALTFVLAIGGAGYWIGRRQGVRAVAARADSHARYQCPMHPHIVSDKPGKCPICAMPLQKVDEPGNQGQEGRRKDESGTVIDGHASFTIALERQQLIGVKTAKAEVRSLDVEIRAAGRVAYDPELYNAIEEYKQAVFARAKIKDSPLADAREGAETIVRSAAMRLRLLGFSDNQIETLAGDDSTHVNLLLPDKTAWIYAEVYEYEVSLLKPGQELSVTAPSLPGRLYRGKVVAVDSVVNAATRTARIRGLIDTPDQALRPETYVNARLHIGLGRRLSVPEDSVLDTGEHQIVFVKKGQGEFEPRPIKLGRQATGFYEVLSGLRQAEEVVTAANFLIDSESRFRAALSAFGGAKTATTSKPARQP